MDAVHESDQPMDIGVCSQHNRVFECYCTICYCMICPSCLMFDSHKGHQVSKIQQGARSIRSKINSAAKEGLLKFQKTQNVLLDIRHSKLSLQQNQLKIIKTTESSFDQLISTIKLRKNKVLQQFNNYFQQQLNTVQNAQKQWLKKQQISQKILQLQGSTDDIKLIEDARFVVEGLQKLNKNVEYKQIKLIEGIKNNLQIGKHAFTFKQIKDSFKQYLKRGQYIVNQLKC